MRSGSRFRALKGWLAACAVATGALYAISLLVFVIAPALAIGTSYFPTGIGGEAVWLSLVFFPVILIVVCLVSAIPAAFAVFVAHAFRIRAALFFGCAGAATGVVGQIVLFQSLNAAAWIFAIAGFVAGLIYWRTAIKPAAGEPA